MDLYCIVFIDCLLLEEYTLQTNIFKNNKETTNQHEYRDS